jgi:hypothetical protein
VATPPVTDVSEAEEIGATYTEVEVDEEAAAAIAAVTTTTPQPEQAAPGRRAQRRVRGRSGRKSRDELSARAAAEDAWVRADLRRIAFVSVVLLAMLAIAYLVLGVVDVLGWY